MAAHQALRPWDSPGKNTGVGCHFLLQCMKVKSQSEVVQSCPNPSNPMDCSLPGPSVHGIFQARVLEWVAIAFSGRYHQFLQFSFLGIKAGILIAIFLTKWQKQNKKYLKKIFLTTTFYSFWICIGKWGAFYWPSKDTAHFLGTLSTYLFVLQAAVALEKKESESHSVVSDSLWPHGL